MGESMHVLKMYLLLFVILQFLNQGRTSMALESEPSGSGEAVDIPKSQIYKTLSPHGTWSWSSRYKEVWIPQKMDHDWRPYSRGHWIYTDWGWTWMAEEEWGWIPFHYGWWVYDPYYGWIWIPGYTWSPAWVCWRYGQGYVGWAPLPPSVYWDPYFGMRYGNGWEREVPSRGWSFVDEKNITESKIHKYIHNPDRNVQILSSTGNSNRYELRGNRIENHSLELQRIESLLGHNVPRISIVEKPWAEENKSFMRIENNTLYIPRQVRLQTNQTGTDIPYKKEITPLQQSGQSLVKQESHHEVRSDLQPSGEKMQLPQVSSSTSSRTKDTSKTSSSAYHNKNLTQATEEEEDSSEINEEKKQHLSQISSSSYRGRR
jgi:hypothetical protein